MKTNVQKTIFFSEKNFRKAQNIAKELNFNEYEVSENSSHADNWFGLFIDENNAFWTIQMTSTSSYHLYADDDKICKIDHDLSEKLDAFREWELGSEERSIQSHKEYRMEQKELWFNYGYGRI